MFNAGDKVLITSCQDDPRAVGRIDRIVDEAQLTADPLHLMRLFGISEVTAVRYIHAARPERTGKPPR